MLAYFGYFVADLCTFSVQILQVLILRCCTKIDNYYVCGIADIQNDIENHFLNSGVQAF